MNDIPHVGDAALAFANSPKVAAAVASGGITTGIAAHLELINGILGTISMFIGCITGTVVCGVWILKFVRYWRSLGIEPQD
jgi:hypothetical protein